MPGWLEEIIRMLCRLPIESQWRRIRIAVSPQEIEEYKKWYGDFWFYHSIRGYPLVIEEDPHNPVIKMEYGNEADKHSNDGPDKAE